jgi:AraC-like DNA-binding protein
VCDALLVQILAYVLRLGAPKVPNESRGDNKGMETALPDHDRAGQLVNFIRMHFAEKLTLQDIAQAVGRSDRLVRDLMQRTVGMPPMRYLTQYRVEKAKEFILYSDYSLKEITELSGFRTVHHFTRVFDQVAHETPGAWRRKNREGICKDVCIDPSFSNVILTGHGTDARHSPSSPNSA